MPRQRSTSEILEDLTRYLEDIAQYKKLLGVLTSWQVDAAEDLSEAISHANQQEDSDRRGDLLAKCLNQANKLRNSLLISLEKRGETPVKWRTDVRR